MTQLARRVFSFVEYVELEERSPIKHEYLDGVVYAMAGGSPEHAALAARVIALLGSALEGRPCRVFTSDLRVHVIETGLRTYPDATVVCDHLERDPDDPLGHGVVNPTVIVEVLSPSTEDYDRGEKLAHYKRIASLREIVLVAHDAHRIEVWRRDGVRWAHDAYGGVCAARERRVRARRRAGVPGFARGVVAVSCGSGSSRKVGRRGGERASSRRSPPPGRSSTTTSCAASAA